MFRYDAKKVCELLQVPNTCTVGMPEVELAEDDILLWYPGIDLNEQRNSSIGKIFMVQNNVSYDNKDFYAAQGHYVIKLKVLGSNSKNWEEQQSFLTTALPDFQPAPVVVAALAVMVNLSETGRKLLESGWSRCAEKAFNSNYRATLSVRSGRVSVNSYWCPSRSDLLWLAAARRL